MHFSRNNNRIWPLIAGFLLLIVISVGGCNGSSNSLSSVNNTELDLPTMFDIRATPEFTQMQDELDAEGIHDKIARLKFYNVNEYLTPEQLEEVLLEIPERDRETFRLQNQLIYDELVSFYNNGGVLILFQPNEYTIKQTMRFLESVSNDTSTIEINEDIELYAITKQTTKGSVIDENNTLALENIFTYVIPNISTMISFDEYSSPDEIEKEYLEFQVERWKNYYYWLASLSDRVQENARTASAIQAAAAQDNNVINISRILTGTYDWSYNNMGKWDSVETKPANTRIDSYKGRPLSGGRNYMTYNGSRTNMLDYIIYSVHSFTDHSDYFVINSSFYTKPQRVGMKYCLPPIMQGVYTQEFPYLMGYTRGTTNSISLMRNSVSIGECISTSMPNGVTEGTNYRESFLWSDEGLFTGYGFGTFEGTHFSKEITFDATNITVLNLSEESSAILETSFDKPVKDSSQASGFSANSASVSEMRLPVVSVLRVGSEEWKNGYDSVKLVFSGNVSEGASLGNYYFEFEGNDFQAEHYEGEYTSRRRGNYTIVNYPTIELTSTKNFTLNINSLLPPTHCTVHQQNYAFNRHGDNAGIKVTSETDWQIIVESGATDWILLEKTSGTATGPEGEWVFFTVPENTTGQQRVAHVFLVTSPYADTSKTETMDISVFQSNNEGHSAE